MSTPITSKHGFLGSRAFFAGGNISCYFFLVTQRNIFDNIDNSETGIIPCACTHGKAL
jgi:hypothetical protein